MTDRYAWSDFYDWVLDNYSTSDQCNCDDCLSKRIQIDSAIQELMSHYEWCNVMPLTYDPRAKLLQFRPRNERLQIHHLMVVHNELDYTHMHYMDSNKHNHPNRNPKKYYVCEICATVHSSSDTTTTFRECDVYHNVTSTKEITFNVCKSCVNGFAECLDCKRIQYKNNMLPLFTSYTEHRQYRRGDIVKPSSYLCHACHEHDDAKYRRCSACNFISLANTMTELISNRDARDNLHKKYYCQHCAKDNVKICTVCNQKFIGRKYTINPLDRETWMPGLKEAILSACRQCYDKSVSIQHHQYKPIVYHMHWGQYEHNHSEDALTFGIELEIEGHKAMRGSRSMARLVHSKYDRNDYYVVHDGSVREGLEIVSHPFSWAYFKENRKHYMELLKFCAEEGYTADSAGVGFHVHTNKKAWTSFQLYKLMKFMYGINNRRFLNKLANRIPTRHCYYDDKQETNIVQSVKDKKNYSQDHYHAVNMNGAHTIEFRIFQGSLQSEIIFRYIEFTHAIHKFTRTVSVKEMKAVNFRQFVRKHAKLYPNLVKFINETYKK